MDTLVPTPGERRRAAVLFADLTGFTALVETLDAEMVYRIVKPLMDDLVAIVRRFGGSVQQVLGDGFMCVFGLRETRGDEAGRAVAAGLALAAAGGYDRPPVHVGLEYGEVFVTASWPPAGYGVWGRPVNLAKRLCDLAGPGEVRVGPGGYAAAGTPPAAAVAERVRVKGVLDPVLTHRLTAAAPQPQAA